MPNQLKYATSNDLRLIAECHNLAFKKTLPARFGKKYIKKMLEWYIVSDDRFLFWMEDNNKCIGYCGGYIMNKSGKAGSATSILQYTFNQAIRSLVFRPWLFFNNEMRDNRKLILKNIKRKFLKKTNIVTKKSTEETSVGLVVIGVLPEKQGTGIGSLLLQEFEKKVLSLGYHIIHLSVKINNINAIKAYNKNGWKEIKRDEKLVYMQKQL